LAFSADYVVQFTVSIWKVHHLSHKMEQETKATTLKHEQVLSITGVSYFIKAVFMPNLFFHVKFQVPYHAGVDLQTCTP